MKLVESRYRGYTRVEVTHKALRVELRAVATVKERDAPCSTLATFVVEDGHPGAQRS